MLLTIDVGNTNIVFGIFDGETIKATFRLSTDRERSRDEYGMMLLDFLKYESIAPPRIQNVIIASVVPQVMYSLENCIRKYLKLEPVIVGQTAPVPIEVLYDNPREIGTDRLVNAMAAKNIYGWPLIIVDFGTATTFCAINAKGQYQGGAILPGIKISLEALFQKAAKLPRVEILKPDTAIGRNTVSSIQSGTYYGYVGSVDHIVRKISDELGGGDIKVIATGGLASLILQDSETIFEVNRHLTLYGLRDIFHSLQK